MLEKGLFRCSPEMVFKVIMSLRLDYLLKGLEKKNIETALNAGDEEEAKMMRELPQILKPMTNNLITIWNTQISPQEFQHFPENLQ